MQQLSLETGDALSQRRFTLEAILSEDLAAIAAYAAHEPGTGPWVLEQLLDSVRLIAAELRIIGSSSTEVPF